MNGCQGNQRLESAQSANQHIGTNQKRCFKCGKIKQKHDFYKHPQMADGRLNKCKECTKKDVAENYHEKRDYYAEYERERFKMPHRKKALVGYQRKRRKANPEKYAAHIAVSNAVRDGKIEKPNKCENCKKMCRIEGHHDDYGKPLDVKWLCRRCHLAVHGRAAYKN
jgi:hypothetical protein